MRALDARPVSGSDHESASRAARVSSAISRSCAAAALVRRVVTSTSISASMRSTGRLSNWLRTAAPGAHVVSWGMPEPGNQSNRTTCPSEYIAKSPPVMRNTAVRPGSRVRRNTHAIAAATTASVALSIIARGRKSGRTRENQMKDPQPTTHIAA